MDTLKPSKESLPEVGLLTGKAFTIVNLGNVMVFVGALMGTMLVFLFSAFAIRAVGETAQYVTLDVRRQFQDKGDPRGDEEA